MKEWAGTSGMLFGEGQSSLEEKEEVFGSIGEEVAIKERQSPRGVKPCSGSGKRKKKYVAYYGKKWIIGHETAEEASAVYEAHLTGPGKEEKDWLAHKRKEITQDANGVACIRLSGKAAEGKSAWVDDEDWHNLTYKKTWCGWMNKKSVYAITGKNRAMYREVYGKWNEGGTLLKGEAVDNENGETLDKRRENSSRATASEQAHKK